MAELKQQKKMKSGVFVFYHENTFSIAGSEIKEQSKELMKAE
jgi:hypothetical protein